MKWEGRSDRCSRKDTDRCSRKEVPLDHTDIIGLYGYHWIMQIPLDYMGALGNNFTQPHSQGTYSLTLNIDKEVRTIMSDGC